MWYKLVDAYCVPRGLTSCTNDHSVSKFSSRLSVADVAAASTKELAWCAMPLPASLKLPACGSSMATLAQIQTWGSLRCRSMPDAWRCCTPQGFQHELSCPHKAVTCTDAMRMRCAIASLTASHYKGCATCSRALQQRDNDPERVLIVRMRASTRAQAGPRASCCVRPRRMNMTSTCCTSWSCV